MVWTLLKPLLNPAVIFGLIAAIFVSSWISDVRGFFKTQDLVRPWVQAVEDRDRAIERKEQLTRDALTARDNFQHELAQLRVELDAAEIARKTDGVAECRWTDNDLRMLNTTAQ